MGRNIDAAIMWKLARNYRETNPDSSLKQQLAYASDPNNIRDIRSNREQVEAIEREYSILGPNENHLLGTVHGIAGMMGALFRRDKGGNRGR